MSYYQRESYGRGWTSVEDIEKSLVGASRITQDSVGAQRAFVPPIPVPQELRSELPEDPYSMFNRRHNGQSIMGRGQMIIEQGKVCNVGFRDQRISQDLRVVPGYRGFSNSEVQQIISSSGQFDDGSEEDPNEPSFGGMKITSTPTIKEAVDIPSTVSPSARAALDFAENPQDAVGQSGTDDTNTLVDYSNEPVSQPDIASGSLEISPHHPETSLEQKESSYLDPFYYTFDDSIYIKVDAPLTSQTEAPTPSPCSSPLPHHSAIDGHYVGCVQMESDSSSSPSPITVEVEDIMDHRNVDDDFNIKLRSTLPDDYKEVMSVWKDYQAGQITSSSLELQISRLLGPYPDLMDAFFKFTSLSTSEEPESLIAESFNGELHCEPVSKVPDESIFEGPDESVTKDLEVPDESISVVAEEPTREVFQEPISEISNEPVLIVPEKTRAAMFEDYIRFCRLVKNKFATQPAIFSEFLALLNHHKEAKIDKKLLVEGATHLFHFHLELVEGFKKLATGNFCPVLLKTAGSVAAKSALKKVARLTDSTRPRRCRNALILNLLKKEAAWKQDSVTHKCTEITPIRLVSDGRLEKNDVENLGKMIIMKACDENGNSDVKGSVVLNDLGIPSGTALGFNSADLVVGEISSTVLDNNVICSSNDVLCPVQDCGVVQVHTEPLCDLTTAESNLGKVSDLEEVDSSADDLRLSDLAKSLPLPIVEKPLELLKPEDIIPDMNAEIPHSTLEIAQEIVSSVMDSVVVQNTAQELEVAFVGDRSSEACVKAEIELLKPSDFVHLGSKLGGDDETVIVPEGSIFQSSDGIVSDITENGIVVELAEKLATADSVGVLLSADKMKSVKASSSVSFEAISSSEDIIVKSADGPSSFTPSSTDLATSTSDVPLMQDQCCGIDSTSDPVQLSDALEITADQDLDTVVVALAKMDLNSDPDSEVILDGPVIKLEFSENEVLTEVALAKMDLNSDPDSEVILDEPVIKLEFSENEVLPLPVSSDEVCVAGSSEMAADEPFGAEVTMTVQAITSDLRTSDVDQSPDQVPGSVPQVTPDCGPLLLRPDQFGNLSTAVDSHQVQQALQKHSEVISLD